MKILGDVLNYLRCPCCNIHSSFTSEIESKLVCSKCSATFSYAEGFIDFLPDYPGSRGNAQKTMENGFIVKIYENYVRPRFTSLGTTVKYDDEEQWLSRQVSRLTPTITVDLACGTGRYARIMSRDYNAQIVFGVDLSKPMLKLAIERDRELGIDNIIYMRADSANLPLARESSNWVNIFGALHLFPNPQQAINEISRISEKGALVTFLTARKLDDSIILKNIQRQFSKIADFIFFSESELEQAFLTQGYGPLSKECHGMLLIGSSVKLQNT